MRIKIDYEGNALMEVKIVSQKHNPLLRRKELAFKVKHEEGGGTPHLFEVRRRLAEMLRTELELVYIKKIQTKTGTMLATGEANAYDNLEQAQLVEPKHIIARNAPPEKPKSEE